MAESNTTSSINAGVPDAKAFILRTNCFEPRYREGDTIIVDSHPPVIGDEVLCKLGNGNVAIGDIVKIDGRSLTLADSCHKNPEPDFIVTPVQYWRIHGCHFGRRLQPANRLGNRGPRRGSQSRREAKRVGKMALSDQGIQRFCVFYLKGKKEYRTPWFSSKSRAQEALRIMQSKYGDDKAIVFID